MSNPTPKPATPAEVSLFIESIGGLIPRRELFPAYRPTVSDGWTWHDCTESVTLNIQSNAVWLPWALTTTKSALTVRRYTGTIPR